MKLDFEQADIQAIVQALTPEMVKAIKPLLNGKGEEDTIFTIEGLCQYLKVEPAWIYKRTALKEIPYIKVRGLLRFRKRDIDRWLETWKVPAVNALSVCLKKIK